VQLAGPEPDLLKEARGALEPRAAECAEQLLRTVRRKRQSYD
jgi:hypothetical protein